MTGPPHSAHSGAALHQPPSLENYWVPTLRVPEELIRIPSGASVMEEESEVGDFGRTYHGYMSDKYLLPNDGAEQDRLDFQHAAFMILMGGHLHIAPIENPKHVLDVATGTGIWATEFAEKFPDAEVIGTDLSAIQPDKKPPNCTFIKDDAEQEWVFPSNKFDYVHLRFVFSCFSDPPRVMRDAFDSMAPGGWIEYQDVSIGENGCMDGNIEGSAFQRWGLAMIAGSRIALGRDIAVAPYYEQWMKNVGFIDVTVRKMIWPASPWAQNDERMKLAGTYMQTNLVSGAFITTWRMLRASGLSEEEAHQLIDDCKTEVRTRGKKFYLTAYVVYGKKPGKNP